MEPLEVLHDSTAAAYELPEQLAALYGGPFGFDGPLLYANFVTTIDGVVALGHRPNASVVISRRNQADRFVMGLLRACADAVLVGAGTLEGGPTHRWTAEHVFPAQAEAFGQLRETLHLAPTPELAVVAGSGALDVSHPALEAGALVLTSNDGARRLRDLPGNVTALGLGAEGRLEPAAIITALRERGHRFVLTEGGPKLFGGLLAAGRADELFLTVSPVLSGRDEAGDRPGLVQGEKFGDTDLRGASLVSVRRHDSHLFLRYALSPRGASV
jgi:riboflavin biosynthesis pyrimidine reductase